MTTALATLADDLGSLTVPDDSAFDAAVSSAAYLPRLQLCTANTKVCKGGKFPINHYALVRDQNFIDLGAEADVLVLSWRPKALDMSGDAIISVYDHNSETFKTIQSKSFEKDSGCMFGVEFLVWVQGQEAFATIFLGSKSSRRIAPSVKGYMLKAATFLAQEVNLPKFDYFTDDVRECQTPFDPPPTELIREQIEAFQKPPEPDTVLADEGTGTEDRAR
jgi:hypothetical protein